MRKTILMLLTIGLMLAVSGCSLLPDTFNQSDSNEALETVNDQEMTLTFSFGENTGTYTGEIKDGLPQGNGKFTSSNEKGIVWTYEGEWEKGHMQGSGATTWENGFTQNGVYQNDDLNGAGKEYWNSKLIYEGIYVNNQYSGQGTLTNYHGDMVYTGNFNNGYFNETPEQRQARLEPFKAQAVELSHGEIYENATNETGQKVKMTGRVFQVYESREDQPYFSDFLMYVNDDSSQIVQVYYRLNQGEAPLTENQMVTVWGTVEYLYTYTNDTGAEVTVPNVEAWSVE